MYPEINEDGAPNTAAVATYVGTDPEGDTISWDLRGADAALFTIDGGVLKFRTAPDYENPRDVAGENTATPGATDGDNVYDIVIRAIASRASGDTGPAETVDTTVTVTVTDVDEKGEVVISRLQPEVDDVTNNDTSAVITATLTDPDGRDDATVPVTDTAITGDFVTWAWTVSEIGVKDLDPDNDDHWGTAPGDGNVSAEYTPVTSDATKYLRVTATYTDRHGADKTARMMSAYPVQAAGGGDLNGSPDFQEDKVDRSVAETVAVDANVGLPITASLRPGDDSKDTLTYSLRAVTEKDLTGTGVDLPSGTDTGPNDDRAAFDIDQVTGQITVAQKLDFESRGTPDDGKYVVVATVTDPSGLNDKVVVVITADDRNEDPVLRGRPELTIDEIDGGDEDATKPLFVDENADPASNEYNVDDEDDRASVASWRLGGRGRRSVPAYRYRRTHPCLHDPTGLRKPG